MSGARWQAGLIALLVATVAQLVLPARPAVATYDPVLSPTRGGTGLSDPLTSNALKVLRVNSGATAFELATASAGGTPWITLHPGAGIEPASNFATLGVRNNHSIRNFDQTTAESIIFETAIPDSYASGSNLTIYIYWTSTATTGDAVWSASVEYIDDGTLDIDADSFDTAVQSAAVTTSGTSGVPVKSTITLSNAAADDVVAGAPIRITIARVPGDAGDTLAADAQLLRATVEQ